jgi:hypothetical protein
VTVVVLARGPFSCGVKSISEAAVTVRTIVTGVLRANDLDRPPQIPAANVVSLPALEGDDAE